MKFPKRLYVLKVDNVGLDYTPCLQLNCTLAGANLDNEALFEGRGEIGTYVFVPTRRNKSKGRRRTWKTTEERRAK